MESLSPLSALANMMQDAHDWASDQATEEAPPPIPEAEKAPAPPRLELPDPSPVLVEVTGDTGILLWQALRDVLAWAGAPEERRAEVFARGAALTRRAGLNRVTLHPDLSVPLRVLADLVADPAGSKPLPLLVAHACLRLARSLCDRGAGLSSLVFAQAAALASPDHPRPLLEVGRLLGPARAGEARVCLLRAAELCSERTEREQRAEPETIAEVHAELAALAFRRRDHRAARGHLLTAVRAARRGAR